MSKSKQKGTAAETAVVKYLCYRGLPVERRALSGSADKGDIGGAGMTFEVKNCARTELAAWVDEARVEAANAGDDAYAVIHKRRGKGDPADWYVTLPLSVFIDLYLELLT